MMAVLLFASLAIQTHNPSADRFEYTRPVRYTEGDLGCGWLGKLS